MELENTLGCWSYVFSGPMESFAYREHIIGRNYNIIITDEKERYRSIKECAGVSRRQIWYAGSFIS